jgi:hypothetical protein
VKQDTKFPRDAPLCHELHVLLEQELQLGNVVSQKPYLADWPADGSVFASLVDDFRSPRESFPENVHLTICNDPHYGWYFEAECTIHKHLLVAGSPKPGMPMWTKA